jgi:hypothetical protein
MLPSTITVLGIEFKVEYLDLSKEDLMGDSDIDKKLIRINSTVSHDIQKSTLFHECIHMALRIPGFDHIISAKTEEAIVRCLEHAFNDWVTIP